MTPQIRKSLQLHICAAVVALAGCAALTVLGTTSPEAQIKSGAIAVTEVTQKAMERLRDHRITVNQAKSYRNMLVVSGDALNDANTDLLACRKETGSTATTTPDPCWLKVSDVVTIALDNITGVRRAVESK